MPPSPDRAQDLIDALRGSDAEQRDDREGRPDAERVSPRLLTLPSALRGARLGVKPSAVWGAALVVVLVLIVVGVRVAWAEWAAQPEPVSRRDVASSTADASIGQASAASRDSVGQAATPGQPVKSASPSPQGAVVHVIGAVKQPGVVTVPAGSRVRDVVEAAGGATRKAELNRVNLARVVMDGERIWVPVAGDDPPPDIAAPVASPEAAHGRDASSAPLGLININTADESGLQELPGVGPVTAAAIAEWRAQYGQFSTVDELLEVSGIGPRTLENLRPLVQIGP